MQTGSSSRWLAVRSARCFALRMLRIKGLRSCLRGSVVKLARGNQKEKIFDDSSEGNRFFSVVERVGWPTIEPIDALGHPTAWKPFSTYLRAWMSAG